MKPLKQQLLRGIIFCLSLCLALGPGTRLARADGGPDKSIAVLEFELIDDQADTVPDKVIAPRLPELTAQLRQEIADKGLYKVVDTAPAAALIAKFKKMQNLRNCNGCELDIGRALGADRVLIGWVQKVSNLILNINLRIEDTATGAVLLSKSADLRGNTDTSFRRGVSYLVQDMIDRHQGDR